MRANIYFIKLEFRNKINFIKPGKKNIPKTLVETPNYLSQAKDWKMRTDLDRSVKIPKYIIDTNKRPDIILFSDAAKKLGMIELTVPREDRVEVSGEGKKSKYQFIVTEAERRGWSTQLWTIEVGCRGFPAASVGRMFNDLGVRGNKKQQILKQIAAETEAASAVLWKGHKMKVWKTLN